MKSYGKKKYRGNPRIVNTFLRPAFDKKVLGVKMLGEVKTPLFYSPRLAKRPCRPVGYVLDTYSSLTAALPILSPSEGLDPAYL